MVVVAGFNSIHQAQVICQAITAFYNNHWLFSRAGLTLPECQVFPAITMIGTAPFFYSITVTEKLLDCLLEGTCPSEKTVVLKYIPPIPK